MNIHFIFFFSIVVFQFKLKQKRLCCLKIKENDTISFVNRKSNNRGMSDVVQDDDEKYLKFTSHDGKATICLISLHMSCKSDKVDYSEPNINYLRCVLYSYQGKQEWFKNGIHCKTGYILLKKESNFLDQSADQRAHQQLYRSLFGEIPTKDIIGAGFAIRNGEILFRSSTFNKNEKLFHDDKRVCSKIEQKWIKIALKNWKNDKQNTFIEEPKDICWKCAIQKNNICEL